MTTEQRYIASITPEAKKWTAKVRVIEKAFPRTSVQSSKRYQRLVLIDGQGKRVQATIFNKDIESLSNTLDILGHYYISNAVVRPIQEQHRIVNNKYQWTISTKTPIREISEEELNSKVIATRFNLVQFSDLPQYIESGSLIESCLSDILAVVADIYPKKTTKDDTTLQEFLLVNHEMKPTILTMWDELAANEGSYISQFMESFPIILATRLKVTSYNGISLSTKSSTTVLLNPQTTEGHALQDWLLQNEEQIKLLQKDNTAPTSNIGAHTTSPPVIPITSVFEANKDKAFWVKAIASINKESQKLWYMCCSTCWNGIYAENNEKFTYRKCGQERIAQPRCNFQIQLAAGATSITTTIFGENAEKNFEIDAKTLMEMSEDPHKVESRAKRLKTENISKEYYFLLKHSKKRDQEFIVTEVKESSPTNGEQDPQ